MKINKIIQFFKKNILPKFRFQNVPNQKTKIKISNNLNSSLALRKCVNYFTNKTLRMLKIFFPRIALQIYCSKHIYCI